VQNYREESYPRQDASASWSAFHQAFVAVVAAVLVGLLLSTFAIAGARLVPAESDCVMTDNAGCVSAPALGGGESGGMGAGGGGK
jgi:hypothetical protein